MNINGNTTAIVAYFNHVVGEQGNVNLVSKTRHRFIDTVINDFPDEVVQTDDTSGANIHTRTAADSFETFEHGNTVGIVAGRSFFGFGFFNWNDGNF